MPRRPLPDSRKRLEQRERSKDSRRGALVGILFLVAAVLLFLIYLLV